MSQAQLPSALAAWSAQLSALQPELALTLGPMLHRLDELVARHSAVDDLEGQPDGLGGLAQRGDPTRLLISQWALAQDFPEEFVRRAASGELLYLAPARTHQQSPGQAVLLLDCGPDMHGAPRLVQLALALVLHRRAVAAKSSLRLGVLTSPAGSWLSGDLAAMLQTWLRTRSRRPATADDLQAWASFVDDPRQAWSVANHRAFGPSSARGPVARAITVEECDWGDHGPGAVLVRLAGERLHLQLPPSSVAIRVLRGQGWRRQASPSTLAVLRARGGARLSGIAPFLISRGRDVHEIIVQRIPDAGRPAGRVRTHHFAGPVLAASKLGNRLVALQVVDGSIEARVSGKPLGNVEQIRVPLGDLEMDADGLDRLIAAPPEQLFFRAGDLLVRLDGRWWELSPARTASLQPTVAAVAPSTTLDVPILAMHVHQQLHVWAHGLAGRFGPVPDSGTVPETHVAAGAIAWRHDDTWRIADLHRPWARTVAPGGTQPPDPGIELAVDEQVTVVGVTRIGGVAGMVTVGSGGLLVKFVTHSGTRVLSQWSNGIAAPALHGLHPLLVVGRDEGLVEVGDLESGQVRLRLETAP